MQDSGVDLRFASPGIQSPPERLTSNPWLVWTRPNPNARLRLFCFPYAGGGAGIYRQWPNKLQTDLEIVGIELPGRGSRIREQPLNQLGPLIELAAQAMVPYLDRPYAFFGHSMGSLMSFEMARYLRRHQPHGLQPSHLFVAGRCAPQCETEKLLVHTLSDEELLNEIRRLNGTRPEILANPELMTLVLPLLRADFAVWETYVYKHDERLACPISAYGGLRDPDTTRTQIAAWGEQTSASFRITMFPGDHFFIHADERLMLQTLARELREVINRNQ